jgi:hypothetical protein
MHPPIWYGCGIKAEYCTHKGEYGILLMIILKNIFFSYFETETMSTNVLSGI